MEELTRAERRELKKKADEAKRGEGANKDDDGDGGDDLIANPNHITKKLNISDLSAPRELTRRERYVPGPVSHTPALFVLTTPPFFLVRREQKEKKEAKERYWKVNALVRSLVDFLSLDLILTFCVCLCPRTSSITATRPLY